MAPASVDPNALVGHTAQSSTHPVSVRSDREYSRSERRLKPGLSNNYWQTDLPRLVSMDQFRYCLKKKGFYCRKTEKFSRLKVLARRCCRGHQSYDACSVKDLKTLIQSRGLKWQSPSKRDLVQRLEAADDADDARDARKVTQKLHRFSELPPELRNRIYILTLSLWARFRHDSPCRHFAGHLVNCVRRPLVFSSNTVLSPFG
jgi:hypothetical protein